MDKRYIPATNIIMYGLVLILAVNFIWFFNRKPLSDNLKLKQVEGEITFYYSESVTEDRGDAGVYYVDNVYIVKGDIKEPDIISVLEHLDKIKSRKRISGYGNILTHITGMSKVYIEFNVDNDFYSYILTDRDNIMRCHSPETGKIINITLNNGDFETIASVIKLYGELQ